MKIIFAQGNPGVDYQRTRHNIGFQVVDYYADQNNAQWQEKTKFKAYIAEATINGEKVLLIKPTTFYNSTGESARALVDFYKINPATDFMAVHDDLALVFGKIRIRKQGSDAGNHGVESLNKYLGQNYTRMRIGTFNNTPAANSNADFVLSKFSSEEQEVVKGEILPLTSRIIDDFCADKVILTSYNT